jgi:uncharacterized protein YoxC
MIIDISVLLIAIAALALVPFAIVTLIRLQKTLRVARRLMHKWEHLTSDIQSKSDSLDFVFRPLKSLNKKETPSEIAEWVGLTLSLFDKLKTLVGRYGK